MFKIFFYIEALSFVISVVRSVSAYVSSVPREVTMVLKALRVLRKQIKGKLPPLSFSSIGPCNKPSYYSYLL